MNDTTRADLEQNFVNVWQRRWAALRPKQIWWCISTATAPTRDTSKNSQIGWSYWYSLVSSSIFRLGCDIYSRFNGLKWQQTTTSKEHSILCLLYHFSFEFPQDILYIVLYTWLSLERVVVFKNISDI